MEPPRSTTSPSPANHSASDLMPIIFSYLKDHGISNPEGFTVTKVEQIEQKCGYILGNNNQALKIDPILFPLILAYSYLDCRKSKHLLRYVDRVRAFWPAILEFDCRCDDLQDRQLKQLLKKLGKELARLAVRGAQRLTVNGLIAINSCPRLTHLSMNGCFTTTASMAAPTSIGFSHLVQASRLQELSLTAWPYPITSADLAVLLSSLKNLTTLNLPLCSMTYEGTTKEDALLLKALNKSKLTVLRIPACFQIKPLFLELLAKSPVAIEKLDISYDLQFSYRDISAFLENKTTLKVLCFVSRRGGKFLRSMPLTQLSIKELVRLQKAHPSVTIYPPYSKEQIKKETGYTWPIPRPSMTEEIKKL